MSKGIITGQNCIFIEPKNWKECGMERSNRETLECDSSFVRETSMLWDIERALIWVLENLSSILGFALILYDLRKTIAP